MWLEWIYLLCLIGSLSNIKVEAAPEWARVGPLPNLNFKPTFAQYSGYLPVSNDNQLFYWFTLAYENATSAPVVLYLNGGPGCSSLQGILVEMGPYRVHDWGARVTENPYAWNRYANVIYLDAPAGVGYSMNTNSNFTFTDDQVAKDNAQALKYFFTKLFPEFLPNDFYIGGESYGGYYIPMLAGQLIKDSFFTNFKGMFVGNGCLKDQLLVNGGIQYNYAHAFIDERYYTDAVTKCCPSGGSDTCNWYQYVNLDSSQKCANESQTLYMANFYTGLDPYFLYYSCYLDQPDGENHGFSQKLRRDNPMEVRRRHLWKRLGIRGSQTGKLPKDSLPECSHYHDYETWLNRDDTRKALHVPGKMQAYASCSRAVEENYITQIDDVSPYVQDVIAKGLKVMFFNGDVDSVCNVVHNQQFISQLNHKLLSPSTPWTFDVEEPNTAGLLTSYQGVDFLTVRGGGHFPATAAQKPREALQMFYNFMHGGNYSAAVPKLKRDIGKEAELKLWI
uniref:Carboxypeptidase n=1 Tax=Panagrellus redivivus TaxID=6233 RepID=A0A7E4UT38_PANRE